MLSIRVVNKRQDTVFEHLSGVLEFGRGPRREAKRCIIEDGFVSRDHLTVEELPDGRLRVTNLSARQTLDLPDGSQIAVGATREILMPARLPIGATVIDIEAIHEEPFDKRDFQTISRPVPQSSDKRHKTNLRELGDSPAPEKIAHWLETIIALQRSPGGTRDYYDQSAQALVELVGLDLGMILLRRNETWDVAGYHAASSVCNSRYSRTLLAHVVEEGRTFFQDFDAKPGEGDPRRMSLQTESLHDVASVVVSPFFGLEDEVVGVLYGARHRTPRMGGGIKPLEAQVVQLLGAAVGANLARTVATRTRVQFEQFFSPELVRELERDPKLLDGRMQEVTILVSDLRGFTLLSERLEPETTCGILRDLMERLTERIVAHGGVIVDYAGDGILAMWNAPVPQADHAARACRAGIAMLAELPDLNQKWQPIVGTPLALGVGVNTGVAQVGNTGSTRKMKYGPHGLTVNLAARVQDATKKIGVPLLIAESVVAKLPPGFQTASVGSVALAGISEEVELYELTSDGGTLSF